MWLMWSSLMIYFGHMEKILTCALMFAFNLFDLSKYGQILFSVWLLIFYM